MADESMLLDWIQGKSGQSSLFLGGILLSWAMWKFSWRDGLGLWSAMWRMYVTVVLTAGIPWFGGRQPDYLLFWTVLTTESFMRASSIPAALTIFGASWVIYFACFLFIWFVLHHVRSDT